MSKRKKLKAAAVEHPVPQSLDECAEFIARIGEAQRQRALIEVAMNEDLAARKKAYEEQAKPFGERIAELTKGVQTWCEANRARITHDGRVKFHRFATGEVKWRLRPPSIAVRGVEAVIACLKRMGLNQFVRTKEEVNREAMLDDIDTAKTVPGVAVSQKEDFVVEPFETQLEEVV